MPQAVEKQTATEEKIEQELRARFTEEQMCACFLTKTIRSMYQFDEVGMKKYLVKNQGKMKK